MCVLSMSVLTMCDAGVAVQLTDQQVSLALQQLLGQRYDRAVGDRVLQELLQRHEDAPIVESPDAYLLGAGFPLHALRSVIRSFAAGLLSMEASQELHRDRCLQTKGSRLSACRATGNWQDDRSYCCMRWTASCLPHRRSGASPCGHGSLGAHASTHTVVSLALQDAGVQAGPIFG